MNFLWYVLLIFQTKWVKVNYIKSALHNIGFWIIENIKGCKKFVSFNANTKVFVCKWMRSSSKVCSCTYKSCTQCNYIYQRTRAQCDFKYIDEFGANIRFSCWELRTLSALQCFFYLVVVAVVVFFVSHSHTVNN